MHTFKDSMGCKILYSFEILKGTKQGANAASKYIESDKMDYLAIADTVIFRGLIMEALLWFLTGWQLCTAEVWTYGQSLSYPPCLNCNLQSCLNYPPCLNCNLQSCLRLCLDP